MKKNKLLIITILYAFVFQQEIIGQSNFIKKEFNHSNNIMNSVSSELREFIKPIKCEVDVCAEKGDFDGIGYHDFNASININIDNVIIEEVYTRDGIENAYIEKALIFEDKSIRELTDEEYDFLHSHDGGFTAYELILNFIQ